MTFERVLKAPNQNSFRNIHGEKRISMYDLHSGSGR